MIIYGFLLIVPTLLWAAMGFPGLGKRSIKAAQIIFMSVVLIAGSAYSIAQATGL